MIDPETGSMNWSGVSSATKRLWNNKNYDSLVTVMHMIQPRHGIDPSKSDKKNKPFMSCYFEKGADNDEVLEEGATIPFLLTYLDGMCCRVTFTDAVPGWTI